MLPWRRREEHASSLKIGGSATQGRQELGRKEENGAQLLGQRGKVPKGRTPGPEKPEKEIFLEPEPSDEGPVKDVQVLEKEQLMPSSWEIGFFGCSVWGLIYCRCVPVEKDGPTRHLASEWFEDVKP